MRLKIFTVVLLVIMLLTSGCKKQKTEITINPVQDQSITTITDFQTTLQNWTDQLTAMTDNTSSVYDSWDAGQTSKEEFVAKAQEIYEQMKQLKKQSDLKVEFRLTESDKQKANYNSVINAYNNAKKDLNDFLYIVPQVEDDQIKSMYNNKIKENFKEDITELRYQLNRI